MMMKAEDAPKRRAGQVGVTLIELMITVVIVAILAAIAIPNYRAYSERAHRTEARSALLQLQADQERFYLDNNQYTTNVSNLDSFSNNLSENEVYTLSITSADPAQGYTATATPTSGGGTNGVDQTGDSDCPQFTITSEGVRTPQGCW